MKIPNKFVIGFQEGTCQLSCNKCAAFGKFATRKKEIGKMDLAIAKKLIDRIAEIGGTQIQPSIYTEPFANPDLKDIILYCNQKGIAVNIITNGLLIDEEWENFIVKNMKENSIISFSLDAVSQSIYEKVRGNYDLEKLEQTILHLLSKRKGRCPKITVNFSMEDDNYEEREPFIEKWKMLADAVRVNVCFDNNLKIPEHRKVAESSEYKACTRILDVLTIDYNGEVRVCQADAFGDSNMGNVLRDDILDVWNGEKMSQLRKRHLEQSLLETDYCYGCEAGQVIIKEEEETEDFLIKKGPYMVYYNRK